MAHWEEFDYVVINEVLEKAVADLDAILAGAGEALATSQPAVRAAVSAILD